MKFNTDNSLNSLRDSCKTSAISSRVVSRETKAKYFCPPCYRNHCQSLRLDGTDVHIPADKKCDSQCV